MSICIIDTSIYAVLLGIPGMASPPERDAIGNEYNALATTGASLHLPFPALLEAGQMISRVPNGDMRRRLAEKFVNDARAALKNQTPWKLTCLPSEEFLKAVLQEFPDHACRTKTPDKPEGVSLTDAMLIQEYHLLVRRHAGQEIRIWSLDRDLQGYHHRP